MLTIFLEVSMKLVFELLNFIITIYLAVAILSGFSLAIETRINQEEIDSKDLINHTILWYKYGFYNGNT